MSVKLHTSLSRGKASSAREASMRKQAGCRNTGIQNVGLRAQTRRRRRNSTGTFLAWRSSAEPRPTIRSERPPS